MVAALILIPTIYLFLLACISLEASKLPKLRKQGVPRFIPISIVVVYRDEAHNLPELFSSLENLNYPPNHFEVLLVNDDSSDGSREMCVAFSKESQLDIQLLERNPRSASAKKDGISQAVEKSKHDLILVTDADCSLPASWLTAYQQFISQNPATAFLTGPVLLDSDRSLLQDVQQIEYAVNQTVSAGAFALKKPFMASAANMAFAKAKFLKINGYQGADSLASGDDVFLLLKMHANFPSQCHYLNLAEATVTTPAVSSWKQFFEQRARWAGKTVQTKSILNVVMAVATLLATLVQLASIALLIMDYLNLRTFLMIWLIKFLADFISYISAKSIFEFDPKWYNFLLMVLLYPFLAVAIAVKTLTPLKWKGRSL